MAKKLVNGVEGVQALVARVPKDISNGLTKVANAMANPYVRSAKRFAAGVKRTGFTASSIVKTVKKYPSDIVWAGVGVDKNAATTFKGKPHKPRFIIHLINDGTKPHKIVFKKRKRTMNHPGTKAQRFLQNAEAAAQAESLRAGHAAADKLIAQSTKGFK